MGKAAAAARGEQSISVYIRNIEKGDAPMLHTATTGVIHNNIIYLLYIYIYIIHVCGVEVNR